MARKKAAPPRRLLRLLLIALVAAAAAVAWMFCDLWRLAFVPAPHPAAPSSPTALALAQDVAALTEHGPRTPEGNRRTLALAADYIDASLRKAGYRLDPAIGSIRNIVAIQPAADPLAPVLVIGAHYDSAEGAPGADDNASGVAVLLELARRLKDKPGKLEIRFVAFDLEEPPNFGTKQMGSYGIVQGLLAERRQVAGMISLEMLGYYNTAPGSQKYPPGLSLFFPSRGNFIGIVSNLSSRQLLKRTASLLRPPKGTPVVAAALPELLSAIRLSDQFWFWKSGMPALMVTDTAYYRNPNYHRPTDTADQLDYETMADVVDGLEKVVVGLSH